MENDMGKKEGSPKGAKDFPKCGGQLPVTTAPQMGIVPSVKSDALTAAVLPDERRERFAQAIAGGSSYVVAYRYAGYMEDTANASRLAAVPAVSARIQQLRVAAAERRVQSIAARMDLLDVIIHTDASEVMRVVSTPCPGCWSDAAVADAMGRALAADTALPNTDAAQPDCKACRGLHRTYDITPTDELSAAGRAIFRGVKLTANGLEPVLANRDAAIAELNKMQPGALAATRSMSMNLNAFVPAALDPRDPDAALRLFEAFGSPGG
jgi:hypothetical protein